MPRPLKHQHDPLHGVAMHDSALTDSTPASSLLHAKRKLHSLAVCYTAYALTTYCDQAVPTYQSVMTSAFLIDFL